MATPAALPAAPIPMLDGKVVLYPGDCRESIRLLPDNSIDSCVCDPPYALVSIQKRFGGANAKATKDGDVYARASAGFMGKQWDTGETAFAAEFWAEVYRVLKPGAHVVAFSGTRTYHRMACAIEDAGFEIRDQIKFDHDSGAERDAFLASLNAEQQSQFVKLFAESDELGQLAWAYGSGFPKSHNVGKAIDRELGAKRETVRVDNPRIANMPTATTGAGRPWLDAALERGYHEKAGDEPATPQAAAWNSWGTALKPAWEPICMGRKPMSGTVAANVLEYGTGALNIDGCRVDAEPRTQPSSGNYEGLTGSSTFAIRARPQRPEDKGRWPANIVHDGSDEVVACFPETAKGTQGVRDPNGTMGDHGGASGLPGAVSGHADSGSAARFFYSAKADKNDRIGSKHPTVKPVDLMQWLCRLVTPPGGTILDPFAGSGSTGEAAWREGFKAILCEREEEYQADIQERMRLATAGPVERTARKIKQVASAGPLFGDNDNNPVGGQADLRQVRGSATRIQEAA